VSEPARASAVASRFHARWLALVAGQPGNPCGVEVRWFAVDLVATVAVDEPELRWVQHVCGFGERHLDLLDEILDWYGSRGIPCRFEASDAVAVAAVVDCGGVEAGPIDLLLGTSFAHTTADDDGVLVEAVAAADADGFAALLLAGHEVTDPSPPHVAALAGFVGAPGVQCFVASVDGRPAGAGVLVVDDGVGYVANASTTPAARGRGVQTALIRERMLAAERAGCDVFASLAIPGQSSHRNLMRAGLEPVQHRQMVHVG
jgi:ribosomal protein S18 acetylase RimI-like enzyme